jgi:hypothetical protein
MVNALRGGIGVVYRCPVVDPGDASAQRHRRIADDIEKPISSKTLNISWG